VQRTEINLKDRRRCGSRSLWHAGSLWTFCPPRFAEFSSAITSGLADRNHRPTSGYGAQSILQTRKTPGAGVTSYFALHHSSLLHSCALQSKTIYRGAPEDPPRPYHRQELLFSNCARITENVAGSRD